MGDGIECEECGVVFDPGDLTQVAIHMHDGYLPEDGYTGEEVTDGE